MWAQDNMQFKIAMEISHYKNDFHAKPFCQCWNKRIPVSWKQINSCSCGEDHDVKEWNWDSAANTNNISVVLSEDEKQVTFHPLYSSGTALVRGDTPLDTNQHHYFEVKMLTETYGTDIMVGVGSDKINVLDAQFKFTSLLGEDSESYGLSYRGNVRHEARSAFVSSGFCRGSIVGVRVDMWRGTLEFFVNRKPLGTAFYNLRRHPLLYPMVCSTAAQSAMRLTYAASWRASLLVDAAKMLAASVRDKKPKLPPGLWHALKDYFWLTLPTEGCISENSNEDVVEIVPTSVTKSLLADMMPSPYMNGFYVDGVQREYRLVVWE